MARRSYIEEFNDTELNKLERKIHSIYIHAAAETREEAGKYWQELEERAAVQYQAYQDGRYTQAEWMAWCRAQIGRGKTLDTLAKQVAERLANSNVIASSYINGATPKVFKENANFEAFEIDSEHNFSMSFRLIDDEALTAVMKENHVEFDARWKHSNTNRKHDYDWSYGKVQDSIYQSLLRGEGIGKVADRLEQITGSNRSAALRNARTCMGSAQSAGRMAAFEQAAALGIEVVKEWKAYHDAKTRDSHADMDGVRVPWDEPFPNDLMYPLDPKGAPEEVYNCRCGMGRVNATIDYQINQAFRLKSDGNNFKGWIKSKNNNSEVLEAVDRNSAMRMLQNNVGFERVRFNTRKIDEEVLVDVSNQLNKLEQRFGVIHKSNGSWFGSDIVNGLDSCITNSLIDPLSQGMDLGYSLHGKQSILKDKIKRYVKEKYVMPCAESEFDVYIATHEYGHMLQNMLIQDEYIKLGWTASNPGKFLNLHSLVAEERTSWYDEIEAKIKARHKDEILSIAKANNQNFDLMSSISEYGLKNDGDFFAEVFANSQLSKPNELGNAMQEWIARKGL